jgi:hypothetical protein
MRGCKIVEVEAFFIAYGVVLRRQVKEKTVHCSHLSVRRSSGAAFAAVTL